MNNISKIDTPSLESLRALPEVIEDFLTAVSEDQLDVKRNADTWTIREHLYHLVDVQQMLTDRMLQMKAENMPVLKPFDPDAQDISTYNSVSEAIALLKDFRKKQCDILESLSEEELTHRAEHKEYREYSLPILVKHMIFHEYWHMYRVEEILYIRDESFS